MANLNRLGLPGDETSWAALGFAVEGGAFRVGQVSCSLGVPTSWGFDEVHADPAILGVPTLLSEPSHDNAELDVESRERSVESTELAGSNPNPASPLVSTPSPSVSTSVAGNYVAPSVHPNGVTFVDHVIYWVPNLDEAVASLNAVLATAPRRRFHPRGPQGPEMAFYRVGEAFLEVVASGQPAALPGIAFGTPDLDATVAAVRGAGGPIGEPKPAVQGGRIASVWFGHLDWGIAFLEPKPR